MRSQKDVEASNRRNETKFVILLTLSNADKHLTPSEIADKCNLSLQAVKSALSRMCRGHYIWRADDDRKNTKNWYVYKVCKPKGIRVLKKYEELHNEGKPLKIKR